MAFRIRVIEIVVMDMEQGSEREYVVTTGPGAVARVRASLGCR
ncbi:hypothetical protein ACFZCY_25960 [Streptomyces sp. NPDC007983]